MKLVSSKAANRLVEISLPVMSNDFAGKYLYVRKHMADWNETTEELIYEYSEHVEAFIELIAMHIHDETYLHNLGMIAEPCVLFAYKCVIDHSIEMLDSSSIIVDSSIPKNDGAYFRKYAGISLQSTLNK